MVAPFLTHRGLGFLTNQPLTSPRERSFCEGLPSWGPGAETVKCPPSTLQDPNLKVKTPQTLKQLENN